MGRVQYFGVKTVYCQWDAYTGLILKRPWSSGRSPCVPGDSGLSGRAQAYRSLNRSDVVTSCTVISVPLPVNVKPFPITPVSVYS